MVEDVRHRLANRGQAVKEVVISSLYFVMIGLGIGFVCNAFENLKLECPCKHTNAMETCMYIRAMKNI
jgi:hypothetical protein